MPAQPATTADARAAVAANALWYHVIEVAPGVATPGWFDLRPIVDRLPWPDVDGKRCLDVGTYDGFLAFELERRGAAEVVATDILDHRQWDWPAHMRGWAGEKLAEVAGVKGEGFRIAKELLGSRVERVECSVYDLSPERLGKFDVVVCGSLMLHLRDPLRALEAIRSVCGEQFLSAEQIRLGTSLLNPRRAMVALDGTSDLCQWWIPSAAGHRRMVEAAGFEIVRRTRPYSIPYGGAHDQARSARMFAKRVLRRLATGNDGVPHAAVLATPRV
jgi:tRNA (mo5U34)-methyltransferase